MQRIDTWHLDNHLDVGAGLAASIGVFVNDIYDLFQLYAVRIHRGRFLQPLIGGGNVR